MSKSLYVGFNDGTVYFQNELSISCIDISFLINKSKCPGDMKGILFNNKTGQFYLVNETQYGQYINNITTEERKEIEYWDRDRILNEYNIYIGD